AGRGGVGRPDMGGAVGEGGGGGGREPLARDQAGAHPAVEDGEDAVEAEEELGGARGRGPGRRRLVEDGGEAEDRRQRARHVEVVVERLVEVGDDRRGQRVDVRGRGAGGGLRGPAA